MAMRLLSTRELADAIGVSESSLKRWIDAGKVTASRTDGGHRRVALSDAMRFIREQKTPVVRPELLDLPEVRRERERGQGFYTYLVEGDYDAARGFLAGKFLEGVRIAELADGPIRDAMHSLGELYRHDHAGIFIEHRGTDICLQAVAHLRSLIPPARPGAPIAVCGAPSGDPYVLPSLLASVTVLEAGFCTFNLGPDTPVTAFDAAIAKHAPKLVLISITAELSQTVTRSLRQWLTQLPPAQVCLLGGQQAHAAGVLPPHVRRLASMTQLAEIAEQQSS